MIDVIIPAYNAHDTIEKTIYSLLIQSISKNINVLIIDDCSKYDYSNIVNKYKHYLNIAEYRLDTNSGPGAARNYGIKKSKSDYIVFLDSDDILYNKYSLEDLYNGINNKFDVLISSFIEEIEVGDYLIHSNEKIWNHGKIYSRKFLVDNNIYFSELRTNEDLFFNFLVLYSNAKIGYTEDITYVWQKNINSITRKNENNYLYNELDNYNNNIMLVVSEFENRKYSKKSISEVLFFSILQMYYTYLFHIDNNDEVNAKKVMKASKKNVEIFKKYSKYLNKENKNEILRDEMKKYIYGNADRYFLPSKTIYEFIKEVLSYE